MTMVLQDFDKNYN